MVEVVGGCLLGLGHIWDGKGVISQCYQYACARYWGSRVNTRNTGFPSWSKLSYVDILQGRIAGDPSNTLDLCFQLFSAWSVLFWFGVKPWEKGFLFLKYLLPFAQTIIPLNLIPPKGMCSWKLSISEIGVCANGMMSHVETCCFEKRLWFDLLTASIGPQVYCALGVEKRVLPKSSGAWFLGFDFLSGKKPNVNNKHLTMD